MIKNKRFCEGTVPGKRFGKIEHCFSIDKLVYKGKSKYQDILIFDNSVYGRVFVLEGIVQLSEIDEHIYHEMIIHPVFFSHPAPKRVLIVGGGDGGALRESLKHNPQEVVMIDIDKKVIELAKKHLAFVSQGAFKDKRLKLINADAKDYIKKYSNYFDIAIIDGEDPLGTSLPLFTLNFYKDVMKALRPDGIASLQIGSFLDHDLIRDTHKRLSKLFKSVALYKLTMPSYHCGEYCFMGASKKADLNNVNIKTLEKRFKALERKNRFKYYSPRIHLASQAIPAVFNIK